MSKVVFEALVIGLGATFAIAFCIIVVPPLLESGDLPGAFAAGFVNPFSSGYSLDVIVCAFILFAWISYERSVLGVQEHKARSRKNQRFKSFYELAPQM